MEIEKQKSLNNCPNCGFEVKKIWNFCPQCHNILKGEQDYTRLLLPNPINDYPYKVKRISSAIKVPQICPICGSRDVLKQSKLKPRIYYGKNYGDYIENYSYLKIFFCKKHTKERKTCSILAYFLSVYLPFLPVILILILLPFYTIFVSEIITILILIGTGCGFIYIARRNSKMSSLIRNHIFHEYYPELGAVIALRNPDWIEEFRGYNKCVHIQGPIVDYLRNNEDLKRRYGIYFVAAFLLSLTLGLLGVFLSVLIDPRLFILSYLGSFGFGGITVYLYWFGHLILGSKRLEEYSDFLWKNGLKF